MLITGYFDTGRMLVGVRAWDSELSFLRAARIRGHSCAMRWRNDGRQAQIMPMLTSMADQMAIEGSFWLFTAAEYTAVRRTIEAMQTLEAGRVSGCLRIKKGGFQGDVQSSEDKDTAQDDHLLFG